MCNEKNRLGGYLVIIKGYGNFAYFSLKTYIVGTHGKVILMNIHNMFLWRNIRFYGEITKKFPELSSNTLISFTVETDSNLQDFII